MKEINNNKSNDINKTSEMGTIKGDKSKSHEVKNEKGDKSKIVDGKNGVPEVVNFITHEIEKDLKAGKISKVVTRFPPSPSGEMHIGHIRGIVMAFEMAKKFGGETYLRIDDTNPAKDAGDYADSYLRDVRWVGYEPKALIYASETYAEPVYEMAKKLIKDGLAYVDELSQDEQTKLRGTLKTAGVDSPFRNRPIKESLDLFERMKAGEFEDGTLTLRAKIDMKHGNILMRDPIIYRIAKNVPHYKTGTKWKIYPMYDFAHPLQDYFEGVNFSTCDILFRPNRDIYDWVIKNCTGKDYPVQREYGRLNLENTLTGKRHLKKLVDSGLVDGWDDPRFLTIMGMKRRGYPAEALKKFILSLGLTPNTLTVPLNQLEFFIREELNKTATRAAVILEPLRVRITNFGGSENIEIPNLPSNKEDCHQSTFEEGIFIERSDFEEIPPEGFKRLTVGGYVRLIGAYIIKCNKVVYKKSGDSKNKINNENSEIDYLECEFVAGSKGANVEGIKAKAAIHFVGKANSFEITINKFKSLTKPEYLWPAEEIVNGRPLEELLTPNSKVQVKAIAEKFLLKSKIGETFQFMRNGYYCLDKTSDIKNGKFIFNETIDLKSGF